MSETTDIQATGRTNRPEPLTVSCDGLTVEKTVDRHRDDVAKVDLTVTSAREDAVRLQLVDQLPDAVEADDVGFHPDHDPDGWHVDDGRTVVYETVVEPGRELETVYGVQLSSPDRLERVAGRPTVEVTELEEPTEAPGDDAGLDREDSEIGGDASPTGRVDDPAGGSPSIATGNADGQPGVEDGSDVATSGADESPVVAESAGPDRSAASTAGTESDDSLVAALVGELRSRELSDDEQATIAGALGLDPPASEQVRLDHVQATVDDLVAYRDALEGFIDEHGPAETVVEEFRAGLGECAAELEALQEAVDDLRDRLDSLEAAHEADAAQLESRLDAAEDELAGTRARFEDDLEAVRGDLSRLMEWREKLSVAAQLADAGIESDGAVD